MKRDQILKIIAKVIFWPVTLSLIVFRSQKMTKAVKTVLFVFIFIGTMLYISPVMAALQKDKKSDNDYTADEPAVTQITTVTPKRTQKIVPVTEPVVTEPESDNVLMKKQFKEYTNYKITFLSITITESELSGLTPDDFREFESRIPESAESTTIICGDHGFRFPKKGGFFNLDNYFEYGVLTGDPDNSIAVSNCSVEYPENSFEIKIQSREEDGTESTIGSFESIDATMLQLMNESSYFK